MNNSLIRLATENDIEQLAQIIKQYRKFYGVTSQDILSIKEFISERIAKSESKIFIAVDESTNIIVGFIQLYPSFSTVSLKPQWILNDFYVQESVRRKGVGTSLMNAVIEHFKDKAKGFILVTDKSNAIAKQFYNRNGWKTDVYDFYTYSY